jgi:hypothetical protein
MQKKPFKSGAWIVDEVGNMEETKEIIFITNDRLIEKDWFSYFRTFEKFNWNHFFPAYLEACERAKIREITFKV